MNDLLQRLADLSGYEQWQLLVRLAQLHPGTVARLLDGVPPSRRVVPVIQGEVLESWPHYGPHREGVPCACQPPGQRRATRDDERATRPGTPGAACGTQGGAAGAGGGTR